MKGSVLTVAISGLASGKAQQCGSGIASALRRVLGKRIRIVALARGEDLGTSSTEAGFDGIYDATAAGPGDYLARLQEVDAQCGLDVIIPCHESEIAALLEVKDQLRTLRITALLPSSTAWNRSVHQLRQSARELGVRVVDSVAVRQVDQLRETAQALGFPLLIKASTGDAELVHNLDAALAGFARLRNGREVEIKVQRRVTGEEYNVAAVRDASSGSCWSVTLRKTLTTRLGGVWAGVTDADREVRSFVERITAALNWHGGCELDLVRDKRGFWLREFAPSLPAWNELSVTAGVNLPLALFYLALGKRLKASPSACAGLYYVHQVSELIGEMSKPAEPLPRVWPRETKATFAYA